MHRRTFKNGVFSLILNVHGKNVFNLPINNSINCEKNLSDLLIDTNNLINLKKMLIFGPIKFGFPSNTSYILMGMRFLNKRRQIEDVL